MSDPTPNKFAEAWRNATDAEVVRGMANPSDYTAEAIVVLRAEALRRGIDHTSPIDGESVHRSVYLPLLRTILRFFMRHRFITAILVGIAYQQASKAIGPILQPYARTTAAAIAINLSGILVFALAIGVLCFPLRTYRIVFSTSAFAVLGCIGGWIPQFVGFVYRGQIHWKPVILGMWIAAMIVLWLVMALLVSGIVFLRNRYRPVYLAGHCTKCGYNLHGLTEPRCPECGKTFERQEAKP